MTLQKTQLTSQAQNLCKHCNSFFASENFNGLCSTCFKNKHSEIKNQQEAKSQPPMKTKICKVQFVRDIQGNEQIFEKKCQILQKDRKKCFTCNKKVGLLGIECKCCFVFCNSHRLPENHSCAFNHKEQAKRRLEDQLIKIDHQRLQGI